jgi:hypothetical protein
MIRTQIQLTEDQWKTLKDLSDSRNVSMAEIIRQSVELYIRANHPVSRDELRRRAMEVVGKFHSDGPTDISTNHDKYLADIYGS